jgi:SulP family sulfate permease
MDTTTADALGDLLATLRARGVDLYLVRLMWPVRRGLRRSGLADELGDDHMWHSISQGVREARRVHGLLDLPAHDGAPSDDEPLDADHEEHIVARDPGPAPPEP